MLIVHVEVVSPPSLSNKCMFGAEGMSLGKIWVCDLDLETSESIACSTLTFLIIDFAYSIYLSLFY